MTLVPRTLFGRILAALMLATVTAQAIGVWVVLEERTALAKRLLGSNAAQRIAGVIEALDTVDQAERTRLVDALNQPPTRIRLDEPWHAATPPASDETVEFARQLRAAMTRPREVQVLLLQGEPFRDQASGAESARSRPDAGAPAKVDDGAKGRPARTRRHLLIRVEVQSRLSDGAVLTFYHALPGPPIEDPMTLLASLAVVLLLSLALAYVIVRSLTRPLSTLARAAKQLPGDLDQRPIPETGSREVADAARAFNQMQGELRRMIETRTTALAAVSHDLRLPITRMRLRLERLTDPDLRRSIDADLTDMERMINNTLEFLRAGKSAEQPVRLDLDAMLEKIAEDMSPVGAEVRLHGHAGAPVFARPLALERCLLNLVDNARRYGGPVIDVSVQDTSTEIEVRVEDRGPGIDESQRDRVFEPYERLEGSRARSTGGTGLGLTIARAVARAHGGDVRLQARAGGGLTAILTLARAAGEFSPRAAASTGSPSALVRDPGPPKIAPDAAP